MADRLKGIVVEIGAETQGLDKALKGVNQTSRNLQSELSQVQRLLKFDPNNVELIAQKQKLLSDQVENTTKKLDQLKGAQAQVQAQFERGDIGADQYREFQREVVATEGRLKHFQNSLQEVDQEQNNVKESSKQLQNLFEATSSTVDDYADVLGTRLTRAIKEGTATSKDLEKAFERVGKEALGSKADINEVREAIKKIDSGEASVKKVRKELQKMSEDAKDAEGSVKDLGGELGGLAAGVAGGLGIGAVVEKAMSQAQQKAIIDVTLNLDEKGKDAVRGAINDIQAYGVEGEDALQAVRKQWQLNADASDETNTKIIKSAGAISAAYTNIDLQELIQESSEIGSALGISQEEALGLTNQLLKTGFPDDQLDIISEYGSQLQRAGYSAEEIQGIFAAGVDTKSWNIDVLLDGVKEGRIRLAEMGTGIDKTTAALIEGTSISSDQLQTWGAAIAEGGEAGKSAFMSVALALSQVESDTQRNAIGTQLFGTLWEEQGSKITDTLLNAKSQTGDLATNQAQLNELVGTMDTTPQAEFSKAISTLWETIRPLITAVSEFIVKIAEWMQKNPELTATIIGIVTAIGLMIGIFAVLAPIVTGLIALAGTLGVTIGAIATPVLIVIGVIAAIIAIGVLLWKNWDTISQWASKLGKSISDGFSKMYKAASEYLGNLLSTVKRIWGNVVSYFEGIDLGQVGKNIIQGLINGIKSMGEKVKTAARNIANGIGDTVKRILKLGSPSKLTEEMGEFTGEGLVIGLKNSMGQIRNMASKMASAAMPDLPKQDQFQINGAAGASAAGGAGKTLTVNINSPKALDIREANKAFNRTLNKMSLMW